MPVNIIYLQVFIFRQMLHLPKSSVKTLLHPNTCAHMAKYRLTLKFSCTRHPHGLWIFSSSRQNAMVVEITCKQLGQKIYLRCRYDTLTNIYFLHKMATVVNYTKNHTAHLVKSHIRDVRVALAVELKSLTRSR